MQINHKLRSRTFWFAVGWCIAMLVSIALYPDATWTNKVVNFAGYVSLAYVTKRAVQDGTYNLKNGNKGGDR